MKRQRSTPEEILNSGKYKVIDQNIAWTLLTKVDVREALKFAVSFGADKRNQAVLELLEENKIWEYWFDRDLDIFRPLVPWRQKRGVVMQAPEWKTYYLWMRLIITCYQWIAVTSFPEIMQAYPPGAILRLIRLNELELYGSDRKIITLDFRKQFPRFAPLSRHYRKTYPLPEYSLENLWLLRPRGGSKHDSPYKSFLRTFFPQMNARAMRLYSEILYGIIETDITWHDTPSKLDIFGYIPLDDWEMGSRPPRIVEDTTLIVASPISPSYSCVFCSSEPAALFESTRPHIGYCSESCQKELYDWVESRRLAGPQDAIDENLNAIAAEIKDEAERDAFILDWEIKRL